MGLYRSRSKIQPLGYWLIGKMLNKFVTQVDSHSRFTNYRIAFRKDLEVTDSYIGIIMDFPRFFKRDEVVNGILMSHYFELLLKARRLSDNRRFEFEKRNLIQIYNEHRLPYHRLYRKMLNRSVAE